MVLTPRKSPVRRVQLWRGGCHLHFRGPELGLLPWLSWRKAPTCVGSRECPGIGTPSDAPSASSCSARVPLTARHTKQTSLCERVPRRTAPGTGPLKGGRRIAQRQPKRKREVKGEQGTAAFQNKYFKNKDATSVGKGVEKWKPLCTAGGMSNAVAMWSSKKEKRNYHVMRQSPLWVFTQKNSKQDLEEMSAHPCSL